MPNRRWEPRDNLAIANAAYPVERLSPGALLVSAPEPGAGPAEATDHRSAGPGSGSKPVSGRNDAQLPWIGRPGRADILCWAGITLSGLYYLILLPFRAELVGTHPVLGELLNGSIESIVAAAAFARVGHGTLLVVMLASIVGLMKFDFFYWWAGRLWGERIIVMLSSRRNRGPRYMGWVNRWGRKFTWPAVVIAPFVPIPNAIIYVIAGWAGMSLITFLILDLIGSLLWAGMLAGLGYELGHHAVDVAQTISHYGLWFSLAIVAIIIFFQIRNARMNPPTRAPAPAPVETKGQES